MLRRTVNRLVTYHPVRYTKDGRSRAPRTVIGPFVKKWPKIKIFWAVCLSYYLGSKFYREWTYVPPTQQFLRNIQVRNYGVLGTSFAMTGSQLNVMDSPDADTVIVDPTSLEYLQTTADDAASTSGAIYKWAKLHGDFPKEVSEGVWKPGDAKLYTYEGGKNIVHVVCPDFRRGEWTEREASVELARAYRNLLHEFVMSGKKKLRLPPLSAHIYSGDLYNQIPPLTQEALSAGFEQLHPFDKEHVLASQVDLCIYQEREWDKYTTVFTTLTPAQKLH